MSETLKEKFYKELPSEFHGIANAREEGNFGSEASKVADYKAAANEAFKRVLSSLPQAQQNHISEMQSGNFSPNVHSTLHEEFSRLEYLITS